MTTNDDEPEGADAELVRLLAHGLSYNEAAETLGTSKATVYRRMRDPTVRRAVDRARATGVDDVLRTMTYGAERSAAYLSQLVDDDDKEDGVRVKAASVLLGNLARWRGSSMVPLSAEAEADQETRYEAILGPLSELFGR